jgi:hypothetical protein
MSARLSDAQAADLEEPWTCQAVDNALAGVH